MSNNSYKRQYQSRLHPLLRDPRLPKAKRGKPDIPECRKPTILTPRRATLDTEPEPAVPSD